MGLMVGWLGCESVEKSPGRLKKKTPKSLSSGEGTFSASKF